MPRASQPCGMHDIASKVRVGCAGWSVPGAVADAFPGDGTHLARYARRLRCAEINSSFYRPHQAQTYARWADSVPDDFRFAVKCPRTATHLARLLSPEPVLDALRDQVAGLGPKLGPLLVQLPPSLPFDAATADAFLAAVRARFEGAVVCEPRHATWFLPAVEPLWARHRVGRVATDPARVTTDATVGGSGEVAYWRLHGSPTIYVDAYGVERLAPWADAMRRAAASGQEVWAILDNTARGHAIPDALMLESMIAVP